jgi:carbon monoxide dehydrogenase subunit G
VDLQNSFTVPADIETAWNTLLDIQAVAPCMPGATLESQDGDEFTGNVKVKLGPVSMTFGGEARFIEKDSVAHRAVIEGSGKEARGGGTAKAHVTAQLVAESATSTRVDIDTQLTITGKAAQFGRGVMQDVSGRLITQFATNLEQVIASRMTGAAAESGGGEAAPAAPIVQAEALDLGSVAMGPVLKRAIPVVIGVVVIVGIIVWVLVR